MRRTLPSLNALRAFEAAGRHLSFTRAARELHVTPAAIGQQVRQLEEYLGDRLFVRQNRSLELSEGGQALLPGLTDAFERLGDAVEWYRRRNADRPLTVSIEPSFAARWLLKRLHRFRADHPGIEIRLDATRRIVDFRRERVDVAVRYGTGDYPGLRVDRLLREEVFPVCSPALLDGPKALREPSDLRFHTLLDCDWTPQNPTWPDWEMWLREAGVADVVPSSRGLRFSADSYLLMLDAAVAGDGVALASGVLVADDLAAGRLVRPFDLELGFPGDFGYFVVSPEATAEQPKIAALRDWLLAEARASDGAAAGAARESAADRPAAPG